MSAHDDEEIDDAIQTKIDPEVPTGTRGRPPKFDPHARVKDHRSPPVAGSGPVAAQVISALPPVRHDVPVAPKVRAPSSFDPHARIDDSSRTAKWAPRDAEEASRGEAPSSTEAHTRVEGFSRTDEPVRRAKGPTKRGHDAASGPPPRARTAPPDGQAPVPRDRSEPMRVISMKTPADLDAEEKEKAQRVLPVVKLRAISDLHHTPPRGMGNLAPPRDPREARSRRVRDNVIWGSLAVILASIVTLAIWFLARR
jgi:hypothetical protein